MGDRPHFSEVREKARTRPIRGGMGRTLEQHHAGRGENPEVRHNGPEGLPSRSADHEEAAAQQVDSTLRCVHAGRTYLYYHRTDETWILAGLLTRYVSKRSSSTA